MSLEGQVISKTQYHNPHSWIIKNTVRNVCYASIEPPGKKRGGRFLLVAHINLAGDGGGYQGSSAFLQEVDGALGFGS